MRTHTSMSKTSLIGLIILSSLVGAGGFIYSGLYPIGADDEHTAPVTWALTTLRERSIERAARDIEVPDLSEPTLLLMGGPDYNDMCAGCHLQPGITSTDLSIGLYPAPPALTTTLDEHGHDHSSSLSPEQAAKRNYWIIKHGIKASGMPAWGPTHSDDRIWAMVAFLDKLPTLTEAQYQILTTRVDGDDHH